MQDQTIEIKLKSDFEDNIVLPEIDFDEVCDEAIYSDIRTTLADLTSELHSLKIVELNQEEKTAHNQYLYQVMIIS